MNIKMIDKDTISVDGVTYKRDDGQEILICTIDGYQYFLGPEYDGVLDWYAAKRWCEWLGDDYELPSRLVMLAVCTNKETAALLTEYSYYWTSSDFEDDAFYAWVQHWNSSHPGYHYGHRKSNARRVRAVRRRRIEEKGQ